MKKISSQPNISPRKYVTIPITVRYAVISELDKLIAEKRFKEIYKFSECNRGTELIAAIKKFIADERKRLETVERPEPLKRIKDNGI